MAELATVTIDVKNLDEVKEYFEKYRWHDFINNHEDVPAEDCRVIRACKFWNGDWYYDVADYATDLYSVDEYDFYEYKGKNGFYLRDEEWGYYLVNVHAWKYIEPMEEE